VILSQSTLQSIIRQSLKIGVSRQFSRISFPPSHYQLVGQLAIITEVQTSVLTMWLIGPQLDFLLAAFPPFLFLCFLEPFLLVLGWIPLSLLGFLNFLVFLLLYLYIYIALGSFFPTLSPSLFPETSRPTCFVDTFSTSRPSPPPS